MRRYGLLNLGRDKRVDRTTVRIDRAALTKLRDALGGQQARNAVAFLCEINEGDDDDELAIARSVFKGWRCFGETTREPIFVTPDLADGAKGHVDWVDGTAVPHWSPRRSVLRVDLADGETLVTDHPAAGPYTPQPRPQWAHEPLKHSWHATNSRHLEVKRQAHQDGRNVTEMRDANRTSLPLLPGEVEVIAARTDHGRAWAAEGYEARFKRLGSIPVGIDSHAIQLMTGKYRRV